MVGSRGLFDTNILIDHLAGYPPARAEIDLYESRSISVVSWIEVLAGTPPHLEKTTREVLSDFELVQLSRASVERTVKLRREKRLKLPDAMILASAMVGEWLLIARNTRDFQEEEGVIRLPYKL